MAQSRRLDLQSLFVSLLGSSNVYYQPPDQTKLSYPCIVYELEKNDVKYADNQAYNITKKYSVTVIDANPDSAIPDKIQKLPMCSFDRPFTSGNLYHFVFNLYY